MTTGFAGIVGKQANNIRKAPNGSVFIADYTAAALTVATVFDPTSGDLMNPIVTGYKDLGWTTTNGAKITRAISTADVTSWGSTQPTRSDVTSDVETVVVECQETNEQTIALWNGVKVSTISTTPDASGAFGIEKPSTSSGLYYRLAVFAVDEDTNGEYVIVEFYPRAKVTNFGDQTVADSGDPILYPVTFTAYVDDTAGYSKQTMYGGAGWKAAGAVSAGFTLGA